MSTKKLITVFGATGAQGGGLVRAILNDRKSTFAVRAVTRNAESEKAKALASLGAEIVAADIDNPKQVRKALKGAYGAYFVTFYWDHYSPERELEEAKIMAAAAKETGLKHAIWSTLEDTRKWVPLHDNRMPTLREKFKVPHFDGKGDCDQVFKEAGIPVTFLLTSFYWDNFINFGMEPKQGPDGKYYITMPMGREKLPSIAAEDIGKCAYGIFQKGEEMIGKTVGISGAHLTGEEMAMSLSKAMNREILYNDVPPEVFRSFGFPGADDMGNMFQFKRDFNQDFTRARDITVTKSLNPELMNFNTWLSMNAHRIPLN